MLTGTIETGLIEAITPFLNDAMAVTQSIIQAWQICFN